MTSPFGRSFVKIQDGWLDRPAAIALIQGEIHLWRAHLDVAGQAAEVLASHLSSEETARADRFRAPQDKLRFAVARGILRELLSIYLQQRPADVVIAESRTKKPSIHLSPSGRSVCFNVSHSGGLAAYAFAQNLELGIDIEYLRENVEFAEIAQRYFSDRENSEIFAAPLEDRSRLFFQCWTLKEAYLKALGEGLPLLDKLHADLSSAELDSLDPRVWSQYTFMPSPIHAGALVAEGTGHRVRLWDWNATEVGC